MKRKPETECQPAGQTQEIIDVDEIEASQDSVAGSNKHSTLWKLRRTLGDFLHFSAPQHVLLRFVVRGNLLDGLVAIPHTNSLLLPTLSSAVTPSHSTCHPTQRLPVSVLLQPPTAASASGPLQTQLLPLGAPAPL
ncbi:hypothetical protein PGT21_024230 [Puccinia graminis f. sp. tritici]|uniref:Uncharacterized protein n=1 Tax=Puccinia graminis f. sp. tritici TaxID=56615 RepID=A0A5B0N500_PUCGR|nr:hypothetical protein PGT21_024230 [Puccinia graminis f. sp. tritici]KAA1092297.1 hypothetical protein PGTUg99_016097 [Puccinia graminis f. sp. tritici]